MRIARLGASQQPSSDSQGLTFYGFGLRLLALLSQHVGKFVERGGQLWTLTAQQSFLQPQSFPISRFGLVELALLVEARSQVGQSIGNARTVVAQRQAVLCQGI